MNSLRAHRATALSWLVALCAALLSSLLLAATPAYATGDVTIDHSEISPGGVLKMLVTVPGGSPVDYGSVQVMIGGQESAATASSAAKTDSVARTTVLAIDTSLSMKGDRIIEARKAAQAYLDTVPANVHVGIVTFDNAVQVRQPPSTDRAESRAVLSKLGLKLNTALYAGVRSALAATGTGTGQRQVLVLSDGKDNTSAKLAPLVTAIKESGVRVDVVSLGQGDQSSGPLSQMASAGGGEVLNAADPQALTAAFSQEAGVLARQVLVTAAVPAGLKGASANVEVSLAAGGSAHSGSAFVKVGETSTPAPDTSTDGLPAAVTSGPLSIPRPVMFAGLAAIGLSMVAIVITLMATDKPAAPGIDEQIGAYGAGAGKRRASMAKPESTSLADQARQAAAKALASNRSLEARITSSLEGGGIAMKSSEWILIHAGIALAAGLIGLVLGGGNPLVILLLLAAGVLGPWLFLKVKRSKRLGAFNSGLADTLQLMSGSLSAGLSLAQAIDTIVREGTEPITSEFKRVIAENRLGVELEDALEGVSSRMQSKDFAWVVMSIRIQREVGGNLSELLLTVASTLREREYLRRHVKALSAEGRLSCWILGGLPPAFLGYLTLTKPDYVHPMYTTPIGWVLMSGMALLLAVGIFWMTKVAKVEV